MHSTKDLKCGIQNIPFLALCFRACQIIAFAFRAQNVSLWDSYYHVLIYNTYVYVCIEFSSASTSWTIEHFRSFKNKNNKRCRKLDKLKMCEFVLQKENEKKLAIF